MAQVNLKLVMASLCLRYAGITVMSPPHAEHLSLFALSDACVHAYPGQVWGVLEPYVDSF